MVKEEPNLREIGLQGSYSSSLLGVLKHICHVNPDMLKGHHSSTTSYAILDFNCEPKLKRKIYVYPVIQQ